MIDLRLDGAEIAMPLIGAGIRTAAMLGAAETLSYAAATGEITATQAESELFEIILAMVARNVSCNEKAALAGGFR